MGLLRERGAYLIFGLLREGLKFRRGAYSREDASSNKYSIQGQRYREYHKP